MICFWTIKCGQSNVDNQIMTNIARRLSRQQGHYARWYVDATMSIRSKTMVLFFSVTISLQSMPRAYGSGATHPSADKPGALIVDGYSRRYTIHIPPNVGRRPPVVFMLHGRGGTKEQAEGEFGWRELADRESFIAVFPQALPII